MFYLCLFLLLFFIHLSLLNLLIHLDFLFVCLCLELMILCLFSSSQKSMFWLFGAFYYTQQELSENGFPPVQTWSNLYIDYHKSEYTPHIFSWEKKTDMLICWKVIFFCLFFAMRCHVELPVTSMRACESDSTFNTPALRSHLRLCSTESYDTREGKMVFQLGACSVCFPVA